MNDQLSQYYESELTFIRQLAGEFAQKHKKIAGRLQLRDDNKESSDPHVERLIEAFALLTARIRNKIDDEFPEIVESLLNLLYPHYLRPIPPMAIAQFQYDPSQTKPSAAALVPAGSVLHSKAAQGTNAIFRTVYPVTLWPLQIKSVSLSTVSSANLPNAPADSSHVLRIQLATMANMPVRDLGIVPFLRFFLAGEGSPNHTLYELLMEHAKWVQLRSSSKDRGPVVLPLPSGCIKPVGFDENEAVLPYSKRSFHGYSLLQEYFCFPEKFMFFDVTGMDQVDLGLLDPTFEIDVFFRDSEIRERIPVAAQSTRGEAIQLGCTPIVNLFERLAEPIRVSHAVPVYSVVPDRHRAAATEVYSVDRVTASGEQETKEYEPFYSLLHTYGESEHDRCFWYESRRPSLAPGDNGSEVDLSVVDLNFDPAKPAADVLSVHLTCTNRDFVSRLRWQREWGELSGEGLPLVHARCTTEPTPSRRPSKRGALQWRLISHLALNHLSLIKPGDPAGGAEALREILNLYCLDDQEDARQRIRGITRVSGKAGVSRVVFDSGVAFCRGLDVEVEFDEENFSGSGAYLMASVLNRFLGLYSNMNSFTRLTARCSQRKQPMARWEPRAGAKSLA